MNKHKIYLCLFALALLTTGCASNTVNLNDSPYSQAAAIKGQGGMYKVGKPYKIKGATYYPKEDYHYSEVGIASWYGSDFHNKRTANGEKYDIVKEDESLLICTTHYEENCIDKFSNITVKKIPQSLLKTCEFGALNYNLNVVETEQEEEFEEEVNE